MEREERVTKGATLLSALARKGNVRIHAIAWIWGNIDIDHFEYKYTSVISFYYS